MPRRGTDWHEEPCAAELYEFSNKMCARFLRTGRTFFKFSQSDAFRLRLPEVVSTETSAFSRRSAPGRSLLTLPLTVLKR